MSIGSVCMLIGLTVNNSNSIELRYELYTNRLFTESEALAWSSLFLYHSLAPARSGWAPDFATFGKYLIVIQYNRCHVSDRADLRLVRYTARQISRVKTQLAQVMQYV